MAKRKAYRARSCAEQWRKEEIAVGEVQRVTSRPHGWVRRALGSQDCCSAARLSPLLLRKPGILKNRIFSKGSSSARAEQRQQGSLGPKWTFPSGQSRPTGCQLRLRCRGPPGMAGAPVAWPGSCLQSGPPPVCSPPTTATSHAAYTHPGCPETRLTSCPRIPRCLPGLGF